jgi:aminopeptidase YwaD
MLPSRLMKRLPLLLAALILLPPPLLAAPHVIDAKTFDAIAGEYSGERAQALLRKISEWHRIQAGPDMVDVALKVGLEQVKISGLQGDLEYFTTDGRIKYQSWIAPMGWNIDSAELWVEGDDPVQLCRFSDLPMCVSTYSKGGEWSGELVDVGKGTSDADYQGKDVKGKVAMGYGYARDVVRLAVQKYGAVGTLIYPAPNDRPEHPDMVRYNGLWTRFDEVAKTSGSFQISGRQYAMLKERMARGPVRVRGKINAELGNGRLVVTHGWIRGSESSDEIVVTAHLDHPQWSSNDNASGSAAAMEAMRVLAKLIADGKLPNPRRTIHFMWVPEYFGTVAYLTKHPEQRACAPFDDPRTAPPGTNHCIVATLNLDMIGEDTAKTDSRFYMTRSPLSVPSFLDALLADALEQTREADLYAPTGTHRYWPAEMIPYFQGSDHDMFLGIGVPSSMFGHDPDWTHHTSEDRPDKTDSSELRRVGVLAASVMYWLANADPGQWQKLAPIVAAERIRADGELLRKLRVAGNARLADAVQKRLATEVASAGTATLSTRGVFAWGPEKPAAAAKGPRRLTLLPVWDEAFQDMKGDDRTWMDAQKAKLADFDLALYETVNFMDGRRSPREIADLVAAETGEAIDEAWVNRAISMLAAMKLVDPGK